jgi:CheY-like chemotaxis protein
MSVVLICSTTPLETELSRTLLWREGVTRQFASKPEEAAALARTARPQLIAIDRRFPRIVELVTTLRQDEIARHSSIVVLARGDFESAELEILEAGANAILRFPPDATWDERLDQLLNVPARRETRFAVQLEVGAHAGSGESMTGEAMNLSVRGMLLQVPSLLEIGEAVTFSFHLPGSLIEGRAIVVRLAGINRYGLFFERLERDGREQIERYIRTLR